MKKRGIAALAATAGGIAAGIAVERSLLNRRRRVDPEAGEAFGSRRGIRARHIARPDGARIFIEEVGPAARRGAVFVHSSAMRTDVWHYQLAGIGGHRLVFYDLRGHGLSQPKGDNGFTIPVLADDLEAVIDDCGFDEVVVAGHSIGGMIAMEFCRERTALLGSKVKGLVLLNTTYRPAVETVTGGVGLARLERLVRRPLDVVGGRAQQLDRLRKVVRPSDAIFWGVAFAAFGPHASARQIDFTYDMLAETKTDILFDLVRSYRDFDVRDIVTGITVPALVVAGGDDRITVPAASEYLAEHLPKSELHILEGVGHMTMLERHRQLNTMLERFFTDTLGPPEPES